MNFSDLALAALESEGVSSPISVDSDGTRRRSDVELWVDKSKLLRHSTGLHTSLEDGELGHTELELFVDVSDLEASTKISKAEILCVRVLLGIGIEDVITPLVLDVHVRPAPDLFDSPARGNGEDSSFSVSDDGFHDSRRANHDLLRRRSHLDNRS